MKFGENLKSLRKLKKISQEQLADKIGVTRQSVSKWECGESYPSMENLLLLCNIFHCKMNDLVHANLIDLDHLGEEVKMNVAKLSRDNQKKMKNLSKLIYILGKILKIISLGVIILVAILLIVLPFISKNIEIGKNEITVFNEKLQYEVREEEIWLKDKKNEITLVGYNEIMPLKSLLTTLETHSLFVLILFTEFAFIILGITLIFLYLTFMHLEKLFTNFYHGETPFTLENVLHIKKMAKYMIITIIVPSITGSFCELVLNIDLNIGFEMIDFIYILFLYSMSYVFLYGERIQKDSKGCLYE